MGAVLVLGLGLYLFVEVRASPTPAQPAARAAQPEPSEPAARSEHTERVMHREVAQPRPRVTQAPPVTEPAPVAPTMSTAATRRAVVNEDPNAPDPEMADANAAYDRGDLEDAKNIAARVISRQPSNVRMLRIMVSASCIDGDGDAARLWYRKLPASDQSQMRVRCERYGVTFP